MCSNCKYKSEFQIWDYFSQGGAHFVAKFQKSSLPLWEKILWEFKILNQKQRRQDDQGVLTAKGGKKKKKKEEIDKERKFE